MKSKAALTKRLDVAVMMAERVRFRRMAEDARRRLSLPSEPGSVDIAALMSQLEPRLGPLEHEAGATGLEWLSDADLYALGTAIVSPREVEPVKA